MTHLREDASAGQAQAIERTEQTPRHAAGAAHYLKQLDEFAAARPNDEPSWLHRVRSEAAARFAALGFPSTRQEEWRFTSVAAIADATFRLPSSGAIRSGGVEQFALGGAAPIEAVFVDGRFSSELSRTGPAGRGPRVAALSTLLLSKSALVEPYLTDPLPAHPFTALNTAFL
jgi:Fe-S cluster assembly protein SufD